MGEYVACHCPHCNEEIEFLEGIGFFHHPERFNNLDELCDCIEFEEIKNEVRYLFQNKKARFYEKVNSNKIFNDKLNYGMQVYYSKDTHEVYNLFYFTLKYLENGELKIYKPIYRDSNGKRLKKIKLDEIGLLPMKCPCCKREMNEDDEILPISFGYWD